MSDEAPSVPEFPAGNEGVRRALLAPPGARPTPDNGGELLARRDFPAHFNRAEDVVGRRPAYETTH